MHVQQPRHLWPDDRGCCCMSGPAGTPVVLLAAADLDAHKGKANAALARNVALHPSNLASWPHATSRAFRSRQPQPGVLNQPEVVARTWWVLVSLSASPTTTVTSAQLVPTPSGGAGSAPKRSPGAEHGDPQRVHPVATPPHRPSTPLAVRPSTRVRQDAGVGGMRALPGHLPAKPVSAPAHRLAEQVVRSLAPGHAKRDLVPRAPRRSCLRPGGTCNVPSRCRPRSIRAVSTPIAGICNRTGLDLGNALATGAAGAGPAWVGPAFA